MKRIVTTFCLLFTISQAWGQIIDYTFSNPYAKKKAAKVGEYCAQVGMLSKEVEKFRESMGDISGSNCYNTPESNLNINNAKMREDLRRCNCLGYFDGGIKKDKDDSQNQLTASFKSLASLDMRMNSLKEKGALEKENFRSNLTKVWNDVEGKRNAVALSASLYFDPQPDLALFYSSNSQKNIRESIHGAMEVSGGSIGGMAKAAVKVLGVTVRQSGEQKTKSELEKIAAEVMQSKAAEKIFKDEIPNPEKNCISPKEFTSFNQLPPEDILPSNLEEVTGENGRFKEEDWNFTKLIQKYNDQKSDELKEKIHFLNKNPIIRLVFESEDSVKKRELMALLVKYKKDTLECQTVCNYSDLLALKVKNDKAFKKGLTEFFSEPSNRDFIQELSKNAWLDEEEQLKSKVAMSNFADNAFARSREELMTGFRSNHLDKSVDICDPMSMTFDLQKCHRNYAYYCKYIEDNTKGLGVHFFSDTGNLEEELERERSINFYDNGGRAKKDYTLLNASMCDGTFEKNGKKISFNKYKKDCSGTLNECRKKFADEYKDELLRLDYGEDFIRMAYSFEEPFTKVDSKVAAKMASGTVTEDEKTKMSEKFDDFRRKSGFKGSSRRYARAEKDVKTVTSGGTPLPTLQQAPTNAPQYFVPAVANNTPKASESADRTIDSYSKSEQRSLLESWQKELEALKNTPVTGAEKQSAKLASEKALEERIAMLEKLIIQQKELSDKQYALLNESLKSKEKELENRISELDEEKKVRTASASKKTGAEFEEGPGFRAPASVRAPQYQSGIGSGETAGARLGSASVGDAQSSSTAMKEAANREALAREEAKLIKLRQETGGAIVLESTKTSGANAIALAISDEFYKQAKGNLESINLKQIEKNIPKDQIDLLEKQGVITLILQNGTNPPLEVKVTRKDGRLVQLDNSPAVVRRVSLQSLQNSFRN